MQKLVSGYQRPFLPRWARLRVCTAPVPRKFRASRATVRAEGKAGGSVCYVPTVPAKRWHVGPDVVVSNSVYHPPSPPPNPANVLSIPQRQPQSTCFWGGWDVREAGPSLSLSASFCPSVPACLFLSPSRPLPTLPETLLALIFFFFIFKETIHTAKCPNHKSSARGILINPNPLRRRPFMPLSGPCLSSRAAPSLSSNSGAVAACFTVYVSGMMWPFWRDISFVRLIRVARSH